MYESMLHLKTSDYVCFLGFFVCLFVCFFFGHKQLRKNTLKVKCEKKENKMQIEHEKVLQNVYFIHLSNYLSFLLSGMRSHSWERGRRNSSKKREKCPKQKSHINFVHMTF